MIKYLEDELMTMTGGWFDADFRIFQTRKVVILPSGANNQEHGFYTSDNTDPYGASDGRLTAGDGVGAPGIIQVG